MELRQLRYFVAVAEVGNISRAAKRIFLTQPALSRQIRALEQEIGQCLLERQAHSVRLTPAGEALLHGARDLLAQADRLLERAKNPAAGPRLRIGYAPSLAAGLLSPAVEQFTLEHPHARVELLDLASQEILAGLENDSLDVAVTVAQEQLARRIRWTPLLQAEWLLAVPGRHPLARRARIAPADLANEPFLAYRRPDYPEYWEFVSRWFQSQRLHPRLAGEYDGVDSLLAAVGSGLGLALVTARTAQRTPAGVRLKTLSSAPPPVCIAAGRAERRAQESTLSRFVDLLQQAARALSPLSTSQQALP